MNEQRVTVADIAVGSLVIERHVYGTRSGGEGVQWLAEVVNENGELLLMWACRTRREALEVIGSPGGKVHY